MLNKNRPKASTLNQKKRKPLFYLFEKTTHGSIALSENGRYIYYQNKDFKGTDTFNYKISNYPGGSEDSGVTVTVE